MPRQTFLSKDFFINASEADAKQCILELPKCISNIKFVAEDAQLQTLKFLYERPADFPENYNYIDVSLLPLNLDQTRITLHGSYTNGCVFYNDSQVANALSNFESAVQAVVKGSINEFEPQDIKANSTNKQLGVIAVVAAIAGLFYMIKSMVA